MSHALKLRDLLVGRADLQPVRGAPGVLRGPFRPGLGWELLEPVFALRPAASADVPEAAERYARARAALPLTLHDARQHLVATTVLEVRPDRTAPSGLVLHAELDASVDPPSPA